MLIYLCDVLFAHSKQGQQIFILRKLVRSDNFSEIFPIWIVIAEVIHVFANATELGWRRTSALETFDFPDTT